MSCEFRTKSLRADVPNLSGEAFETSSVLYTAYKKAMSSAAGARARGEICRDWDSE